MAKIQENRQEVVKLYAVNKKYKEKPFLATAVTDPILKKFVTGQEHLTESQLSKSDLIIKHTENYMLRNNDELVLEVKPNGEYVLNRDYALYCLYSVVPEIAKTKDDVVMGVHLFYMQNFEKEAESKISVSKVRAKAYAKVSELVTLQDMVDILFYFGDNATNMTPVRAEARIYGLVETIPSEVLEYFKDLAQSQKMVFIKKALANSFIKKQSNGYLLYGDIMLGANEQEAATFVFDDRNSKVYAPLKDQLDKKNGLK